MPAGFLHSTACSFLSFLSEHQDISILQISYVGQAHTPYTEQVERTNKTSRQQSPRPTNKIHCLGLSLARGTLRCHLRLFPSALCWCFKHHTSPMTQTESQIVLRNRDPLHSAQQLLGTNSSTIWLYSPPFFSMCDGGWAQGFTHAACTSCHTAPCPANMVVLGTNWESSFWKNILLGQLTAKSNAYIFKIL